MATGYVERLAFGACEHCPHPGVNLIAPRHGEFSNAGWHLALHVERLMLEPAEDDKLDELARLLRRGDTGDSEALPGWFDREFRDVMGLVPDECREEFAEGVCLAAMVYNIYSRLPV